MSKPARKTFALSIALSLGVSIALPSQAASVVSHWNLDEASGTQAADSGPGGHNGTLAGGASFVPGQGILGGALSLVSTTGSLVNMGNVLGLSEFPSGSFSIAAWVRSSTPSTETQMIASKTDITNQSGFVFGFNPTGGGFDGSAVFFVISATPSGVISTTPVNDGQWHLVVGTYAPPPGLSSIFVDSGPAEATVASPTYTGNSTNFLLGGVNINAQPVSYLTGLLDEVRVFDGVLSQAEVEALYSVEGIFYNGFD
ncbi:MAG: LamG domain-containing protein [Dokdonella sp.]|nr:LamG domain-containing protein [Dokdonella sp.]MBP6329512.1 LamG domain-containing protein [Dokdonella sp.]